MKEKLLIANPKQLGHSTGYHHYARILKDYYDITVVCYDQNLEKLPINGVNTKYVKKSKYHVFPLFHFIIQTIIELARHKNALIVYTNLSFIFAIPSLLKKNIILDIRTGSIKKSAFKRWLYNARLTITASLFKKVTILSDNLRKKLLINKKNTLILSIGAEIIKNSKKSKEKLILIYVGTFTHRNIHDTILAVYNFIHEKKLNSEQIEYHIIGHGRPWEENKINTTISKLNLQDIITYHGRKNHDQVKHFLKRSNVGISYIPITNFFNFQPPTKTIEYILSGNFCIATNTYENANLIQGENGILCEDTPIDLKKALEITYKKLPEINPSKIISTLNQYSWEKIVKNQLLPFIQR